MTTAARRIGAGEEHPARFRERALERHAFRQQRLVQRLLILLRSRVSGFELRLQLRQQHVDPRRQRSARRERLEHRHRRRERDVLCEGGGRYANCETREDIYTLDDGQPVNAPR